ncbi:MAG: carbamoyl phosphate synthase large subunit, partial [bacterium]|nr:carbamoyl phosphate synthase large subunit [bacterium]
LARELEAAGVPLLGTPTASIHRAEDRGQFGALLDSLDLQAPAWGVAHSEDEALEIAGRLGYPVLSRPSYVLGGRAMAISHGPDELRGFLAPAFAASATVLIDRFLGDALEVDVDALFDGTTCRIMGVMEHLEEAGVHSGDSTCSLPPHTLSAAVIARLEDITGRIARALEVRGPINLQFALQGESIHVLEVNPRASRTLPFVAKATGVAWARVATRVMLGDRLETMDLPTVAGGLWAVKAPVFPFARFPGSRPVLGPEMRSTGEAMGIGPSFAEAHVRALLGTGVALPATGATALWLAPAGADADLRAALEALGVTVVDGPREGQAEGPGNGAAAAAEGLRTGRFTWVVAPASVGQADGWDALRRLATDRRVPWFTHRGGVRALIAALEVTRTRTGWTLTALQDTQRSAVEV